MFRGKLTMATDLILTHSSRRGLFTLSLRNVINFLTKKGMKTQDIKNLFTFILTKIAAVMNDFSLQMCKCVWEMTHSKLMSGS